MDQPSRPHRPAPHADLTGLIDAAGGLLPSSRAEIAAATAALLMQAGREQAQRANKCDQGYADSDAEPERCAARLGREPGDQGDDRFVALADRVGIDTLAALWQDSEPVSLPGALWALYLLRMWFHSSGEEVRRLWQAGEPLAPADAVVAGVAEPGDIDSVRGVADSVLGGVYRGDFAVALERAAAVFRVVAAGRRSLAGDDEHGEAERERADRNDRVAADLTVSASRWRAGTLT